MINLEIEDYIRANCKNLPIYSDRLYFAPYVFLYSNNKVRLYYITSSDESINHRSIRGNYGLSSLISLGSDDSYTFIGDVSFIFPRYTGSNYISVYGCVDTSLVGSGGYNFDYQNGNYSNYGTEHYFLYCSDTDTNYYLVRNPDNSNNYVLVLDDGSIDEYSGSLGGAENMLIDKYEQYETPCPSSSTPTYEQLRAYVTCLLNSDDLCCLKRCLS